jgi:hypothetical protein
MESINKTTLLRPGQEPDQHTMEVVRFDDGSADMAHECDHEDYGCDWGAPAYRKLVEKEGRPKENLSEGRGYGKYDHDDDND